MFNKPDQDKIKKLGPDRACAEWVLRNGGKIVWADGKKLTDYNSLPDEKVRVPQIAEIDATDSGISHYGFPHLGRYPFCLITYQTSFAQLVLNNIIFQKAVPWCIK